MNDHQARIIVGVDGSAGSAQALRTAHRLSLSLGCTLDVVAAFQLQVAWGSPVPPGWDPGRAAEEILTDVVSLVFGNEVSAGLRTFAVQGQPAKMLTTVSRHAEMLVVGSRGHGGFTGLLLGSVSAACATHARCPVLIVPGSSAEAGPGLRP